MRNSAPLDYVLQELDKLNKQIIKLEEDYKIMKAKFDKNEDVMPSEKDIGQDALGAARVVPLEVSASL